ncbi:1,4-dihydroxy-2-naphthoate octaprenyltransferase, partial [Salibacteraceae bacterium]|nr:1,4-dihydroxy-2-naphthoate octaprenyltransferase [Salibacteraceae bacterium]
MDVETHIKSKSKVGAWIGAMRLRTLPLAIASTILGSTIAEMGGKFDWSIALLTGLTTILLQINSNLANDYGDFEKGTDDESRIGPMRAMQSGDISEPEMKRAIMLFSALSFIAGLALIWIADLILVEKVIFLIAGIAAIFASIRYTAGSNPYGYRGLGDLSVLFFFGILGVYGAFYIQVGV